MDQYRSSSIPTAAQSHYSIFLAQPLPSQPLLLLHLLPGETLDQVQEPDTEGVRLGHPSYHTAQARLYDSI